MYYYTLHAITSFNLVYRSYGHWTCYQMSDTHRHNSAISSFHDWISQRTLMNVDYAADWNSAWKCDWTIHSDHTCIHSSPPGQNGRHFADDIFKCISLNEKFCILNQLWLKFVPKGLIDNKWALVQVMAWCRTGNKPLPEPMLIQFTDAYMRC